MKLLGSTKSKISKDGNGENVPHLEITEAVLIHYNIISNNYQQDPRVVHILVPKKSYGPLLHISPTNFVFLKAFNSESLYIEVLFTDQNSKPLEIEDKRKITLVIH